MQGDSGVDNSCQRGQFYNLLAKNGKLYEYKGEMI